MNRMSLVLALTLVFGLLATPVVNAEEVSNGDEYLAPGQGGNEKEFVMPGDNVSITPKNKFGAPEGTFLKAKKAFLKAKKAFGINTGSGADIAKSISKRSARTGRNPQTGKEIQ
jgi:hypothetical protein